MARRWLTLLALIAFGSAAVADPSSAEEYLQIGDNKLMQDDYSQAITAYEEGIKGLTDQDSLVVALSLRTNLGTALYTFGRLDEAVASYQAALTVYRASLERETKDDNAVRDDVQSIAGMASFYLGMVYQDKDQALDAVEAYQLAYTVDPLHWSAYANLGSVYQDMLIQYDKAIQAYNQAYLLLANAPQEAPTDLPAEPRFILSQLQYRVGVCLQHFIDSNRSCALDDEPDKPVDCQELATHAFSLSLEYDPDNEAAKHMLAAITADATVRRASNSYVKSLFDDYAKNFEFSLVQELGYTGYERLRHAFDRYFDGKPPRFHTVVDAGCGTGLAGEQFRNLSNTLIGVDLSQGIIDQATELRPDLYNMTIVGDLIDVFRDIAPISLIIAADSYIYFGDLEPLFEAMKDGLGAGAYATFTLENVSDEDEGALAETSPDWRWKLTPSGRFAHRKSYVESVAMRHGLSVVDYEPLINFRYERGVGVRGHVFILKKTTDNDEL